MNLEDLKEEQEEPEYHFMDATQLKEWDWEDENGNKWINVCGGPPQLYSDMRIGGPGSFVDGRRRL